jgi:hypothetical protein
MPQDNILMVISSDIPQKDLPLLSRILRKINTARKRHHPAKSPRSPSPMNEVNNIDIDPSHSLTPTPLTRQERQAKYITNVLPFPTTPKWIPHPQGAK